MRSLMVLFGLCFIGNSQAGTVYSIDSANPSCMLEGEPTVTIYCEIMPTSPVTWKKNSAIQTSCDNTADDCLPARNGKNSFTSNITQNLFLFNIANVTLGTDEGLYVCETAGDRKSIQLDVCKVPTSISIAESGSDIVNFTATSDCVYPGTNLTFKWFYVSLAPPSPEELFDVTQTTATEVSDCTHGAKKVSNSIHHTQATRNRREVYFLVKVSHPKLNGTVVNRTANTYFVTDRDSSSNLTAAELTIIIVVVALAAAITLITVIMYKKCGTKTATMNNCTPENTGGTATETIKNITLEITGGTATETIKNITPEITGGTATATINNITPEITGLEYPSISFEMNRLEVEWEQVPGAGSYQVTIYRLKTATEPQRYLIDSVSKELLLQVCEHEKITETVMEAPSTHFIMPYATQNETTILCKVCDVCEKRLGMPKYAIAVSKGRPDSASSITSSSENIGKPESVSIHSEGTSTSIHWDPSSLNKLFLENYFVFITNITGKALKELQNLKAISPEDISYIMVSLMRKHPEDFIMLEATDVSTSVVKYTLKCSTKGKVIVCGIIACGINLRSETSYAIIGFPLAARNMEVTETPDNGASPGEKSS